MPGLFHLARSYYRGNRVERRMDFERRYRFRVPDERWPVVDARLTSTNNGRGGGPGVAGVPWGLCACHLLT